MYLNKLIDLLYTVNENAIFARGFHNAHSYRGHYEELAVEPKDNVPVSEMISCLERAVGETYTGYKGGEFTMIGSEDVYLAFEGCCGDRIIGYKVTDNGYHLVLED